jgi:type I restriction enzyme S subunit
MSDLLSKELPDDWRWAQLVELCEKITDGTHHSPVNGPTGKYKYITAKNIKPWGLDLQNITYIDEATHREIYARCDVRKNDVLFIKDGATTGQVVVNPLDEEFSLLSSVGVFRTNEKLDPHYLRYALLSPYVKKELLGNMAGVAITRLTLKKLKAAYIPVAPVEQQKRIVAKIEELFSHIDAGIEALKKAKQLLKQYRQSVLKAAVTGELTKEWREANKGKLEPASQLLERILKERRQKCEKQQLEQFKAKGKMPKDNKWKEKYKEPIKPKLQAVGYPDTWIWVTWDQVGLSQNGRAFPSKEYCNSGFKLLRPGNLHVSGRVEWTEKNTKNMPISWADEFPNYIVEGNELVMNLTAQSLADEFLGRVCLTGENEKCLLNQRIARLMPILVDEKYLLYLFKSNLFRSFVDGLNTGSLIQHMYTTQLVEFEFPLPPVDEQLEIVKVIEQKLSAIEHIELTIDEQCDKSDVNKQSILASAFSGDLE